MSPNRPFGRIKQDDAEHDADGDDLQRGGARLLLGREQHAGQRARSGPDRPDQDAADDGALLLPEPPTISITQTWKVRIGR